MPISDRLYQLREFAATVRLMWMCRYFLPLASWCRIQSQGIIPLPLNRVKLGQLLIVVGYLYFEYFTNTGTHLSTRHNHEWRHEGSANWTSFDNIKFDNWFSLTMTIPHMSIMLDSQMEGLSRHKRTLLTGYKKKKRRTLRTFELPIGERHTSNSAYGKKKTVNAIKYCLSLIPISCSRL